MNRSRWLQAVFLFVRFGRLDQKELFRDSFEFMEYTWPICHHISVTIFFASFWSFITYLSFTIGVLCKSKFGFFSFVSEQGRIMLCQRVVDKQTYVSLEKMTMSGVYFVFKRMNFKIIQKKYFLKEKTRHLNTGRPKNKWLIELVNSHGFRVLRNQVFVAKIAGCEGR